MDESQPNSFRSDACGSDNEASSVKDRQNSDLDNLLKECIRGI